MGEEGWVVPAGGGWGMWLWGINEMLGATTAWTVDRNNDLTGILLSLTCFFHLKVSTPWLYLSHRFLSVTWLSKDSAILRFRRPSVGSQWKKLCRKIAYFSPFSIRRVWIAWTGYVTFRELRGGKVVSSHLQPELSFLHTWSWDNDTCLFEVLWNIWLSV